MSPRDKLLLWADAQKRHRLTNKQIQMARELGFDPRKLGKLDNQKQEPWKTPLPQHIENLYVKRFNREEPLIVKSIAELLKEDDIKRRERKKDKDRKRALRASGPNPDSDSGDC